MPGLSPEREAKFRRVVSRRQPDLTVILENVYDTHNIGAVLRSCDSVGISEIFALYNEPGKGVKQKNNHKKTTASNREEGGAAGWVPRGGSPPLLYTNWI